MVQQKVPHEPTDDERAAHMLTHEPFKDWRAVCAMYRSRQDPHPKSDHVKSGHSVVSYDFGFCSRMADEQDKQACLFVFDEHTKLMHAIPSQRQGGRDLQYLVRSDCEPATLALSDAVRRTCRGLGIVVHHEPVAVGDHQSNGAAETTVQQIRSRAGMFVQQIEEAVAGGKPIFPCNSPLYCWALAHSAWVHNHYVVAKGMTAYERNNDRAYSGKIALFGETALAYLKTDLKAGPRWQKAVWLTTCVCWLA